MAKTVPLDAPTLAWARSVFATYYGSAPPDPPPRLARREFAAFPFATETMMRRHATIRSSEEFREFLGREVPRHVYYSTAYYRFPDAPTMPKKEWLGADLIFDLDADHLRGAETKSYTEQLRLVKTRLVSLVDDFLIGDFGIDPAEMRLVFSGGRGYHVHVRDDRFLPLTSPERRELVDYILGTAVEPERAFHRRRDDVRSGYVAGEAAEEAAPAGSRRAPPKVLELDAPDAPGWRGRIARAVFEKFRRWEGHERGAAVREMVAVGMPPEAARKLARELARGQRAALLAERRVVGVLRDALTEEVLEGLVQETAVAIQGETDAPVTTDIHRLIRLPGSLHGGTGFRVTPLAREAIDDFDPFRDAVPATSETERTPVRFREAVDYPFPGGLTGTPGADAELPTPQALFLVLRGEAELRLSPGS